MSHIHPALRLAQGLFAVTLVATIGVLLQIILIY